MKIPKPGQAEPAAKSRLMKMKIEAKSKRAESSLETRSSSSGMDRSGALLWFAEFWLGVGPWTRPSQVTRSNAHFAGQGSSRPFPGTSSAQDHKCPKVWNRPARESS